MQQTCNFNFSFYSTSNSVSDDSQRRGMLGCPLGSKLKRYFELVEKVLVVIVPDLGEPTVQGIAELSKLVTSTSGD